MADNCLHCGAVIVDYDCMLQAGRAADGGGEATTFQSADRLLPINL